MGVNTGGLSAVSLFFVDYDLRKLRNYDRLYAELERLGAVRVLESLWCLRSASITAASLRDRLKSFVDGDDALCVSKVTDWATFNAKGTPNNLRAMQR